MFFLLIVSCKGNGKDSSSFFPQQQGHSIQDLIVSLKISVLDGVNSTHIVNGSVLSVYESDSTELYIDPIKVDGKPIIIQVVSGKSYDFVVEGSKTLAASAIKNIKINKDKVELSIIQLKRKSFDRPSSLQKLVRFIAIIDGKEVVLKDGISLPRPLTAKIYASIFSSAGAITDVFHGGFGAKLMFNSTPFSVKLKSHPFLSGVSPISYENIEKDGGWENIFVFDIAKHRMGEECEIDFVLVSYDVVGNRLENHTTIFFEGENLKPYQGNDISITNINCNIKSSYASMNLYSLDRSVYYFPNFSFNVEGEYAKEILGFKLFRRCKKDEVCSDFVRVSEVLYNRACIDTHVLVDSYGGMKLSQKYEYKIRAILAEGFYVDSPLFIVYLIQPFEIELISPTNHSTLSNISDFSFKIVSSNASLKELFSKKNADCFIFGLNIRSYEGRNVFASSFKYWFDDEHMGNKQLEIFLDGRFYSLYELGKKKQEFANKSVSDFLSFNFEDGVVSIKKDLLLQTNMFGSHVNFIKYLPYYWDICIKDEKSSGSNFVPCMFYKEIKQEKVNIALTSHTSVLLRSAFTSNGGFTFNFYDYNDNSSVISNSYIVKAKDCLSFDFLNEFDASIVDRVKVFDDVDETYYNIVSNKKEDILTSLLSKDGVISVERDVRLNNIEPVSDEYTSLFPFNLKSYNGDVLMKDPLLRSCCYSLSITEAYRAYDEFGFGNNEVVAAIMDTGINVEHEDFISENGNSIITNPGNDDLTDQKGHGTHCAGIIAGIGNNEKGIAGVSWKNTKLFPLKMSGSTIETYKRILDFIEYVKIKRASGELKQKTIPLNMSFGATEPLSLSLEVVYKALNEGILPIVAVGNSGSHLINYPAAYPGVVAVGSSNSKDELSSFSTRGKHICVVAPGEAIMSCGRQSSSSYFANHGTSMAAPFVTGTVAYLMGFNLSLTPNQVKTVLEETADKIEGGEMFNSKRGFGRVNVYEAVKLAKSGVLPENKFFNGNLEVISPVQGTRYIIAIYNEENICVAVSNTNKEGKVRLKGLLPGNYSAKLCSPIGVENKNFVIPSNSNDDVVVSF